LQRRNKLSSNTGIFRIYSSSKDTLYEVNNLLHKIYLGQRPFLHRDVFTLKFQLFKSNRINLQQSFIIFINFRRAYYMLYKSINHFKLSGIVQTIHCGCSIWDDAYKKFNKVILYTFINIRLNLHLYGLWYLIFPSTTPFPYYVFT
jgi:hypothetical protein